MRNVSIHVIAHRMLTVLLETIGEYVNVDLVLQAIHMALHVLQVRILRFQLFFSKVLYLSYVLRHK